MKTRADMRDDAEDIAEAHGCDSDCMDGLREHDGPFLLIESEDGGSRFWATRHWSPEEAATYNLSQEFDWYPLELVDLRTGDVFEANRSIRWEQKKP